MSRRRRVTVAAVFVVLLALGRIIPTGPILGQIFGVSAPTIHDAATLPGQITVCGRDWSLSLVCIRSRARAGLSPPLP